MDPLFITLAIVVGLILGVGGVVSYRIIQKQKNRTFADGGREAAKHPFLLNPIILSYILISAAVVVFSYLFYMYFFS
jgi:hypothetical protein